MNIILELLSKHVNVTLSVLWITVFQITSSAVDVLIACINLINEILAR